jgi:parallel beta-helix repeat protein
MKKIEMIQKAKKQRDLSPVSIIILMMVLSLIFQPPINAANAAFKHPGIYQTKEDLEFMKQKVMNGEQPWKDAFDQVKASISLDGEIKVEQHIVRGPFNSPSIGADEFSSDAGTAYKAALVWYISGEVKYAKRAIEILDAWSPNVWDFDYNDAKLLVGLVGHKLCNAAEILRYSNSGWSQEGIESFERMLLETLYPYIRFYFPEANGNWDGAMIQTIMAIAVFTDQPALFDNAVNHFLRGRGNGSLFKYIYPNGQCQESTRDQGHVQLGLGEFAGAARIAWSQGLDLFSEGDNRLALGFEYTMEFLNGGKPLFCYGAISERARELSMPLEMVYQHYRSTGLDLPHLRTAAEKMRWRFPVDLLTAFRAPDANKVINADYPKPMTIGYPSGALKESGNNIPADAIRVNPGDPLQAAIDQAASLGKWVVLTEGVHFMDTTLVIPSGTTLVGEGLMSILHFDQKVIRCLVNKDDNLHDVTLSNFILEGAETTDYDGKDPNSGRMHRALRLAPQHGGIFFISRKMGQMKNITFDHLTLLNFTHQGIYVSGAENVNMIRCNLSDNGSCIVPGPRLNHNFKLDHVRNVTVKDSRLSTSPFGSGLSVIRCEDVSITNCEITRNDWFGIHLASSRRIVISGCLIEANSASGIYAESLYDGSEEVTVSDNIIQYNDGYGFVSYGGRKIKTSGNQYTKNGVLPQQEKISDEGIILTSMK